VAEGGGRAGKAGWIEAAVDVDEEQRVVVGRGEKMREEMVK
jgi:hypothetical protein